MNLSLEAFKSYGITPAHDRIWKQTHYYHLSCQSELYGSAFFITLSKYYVKSRIEALASLLQRFCKEGEGEFDFNISLERLYNFYQFEGYLCANHSEPLSIIDCINSYQEIVNGMRKYESFCILKNGIPQQEFDLIIENEILAAESIVNKWNMRQYLIETKQEYVFFDWGTTV